MIKRGKRSLSSWRSRFYWANPRNFANKGILKKSPPFSRLHVCLKCFLMHMDILDELESIIFQFRRSPCFWSKCCLSNIYMVVPNLQTKKVLYLFSRHWAFKREGKNNLLLTHKLERKETFLPKTFFLSGKEEMHIWNVFGCKKRHKTFPVQSNLLALMNSPILGFCK